MSQSAATVHTGDRPTAPDPVTSTLGQAPLPVWRTYKAGGYPEDLTVADGEKYLSKEDGGEVMAIRRSSSTHAFHAVNGAAAGSTGYTHQWLWGL